MGYDDDPKPFKDTHAAAISRMLLQKGFQKYLYQEKLGFIVRQFGDLDQRPRLNEVRLRSANSNIVTDPKACKDFFDKMWAALRQDGLYVKYGWTHEGTEDRSALIVAKLPFTTPYDAKKHALLPVDATVGELRGTVFNLIAQGNVAATQGYEGFTVHDDPSGKVVYVTWKPSAIQAQHAPTESLKHGRARVTSYHLKLRELLPCALLAQDDDPYGTLMVGITWVDVYNAYTALIEESWNLTLDAKAEHPVAEDVEAAKEDQKAPFLGTHSFVPVEMPAGALEAATGLLSRFVESKAQERADRLVQAVSAAEVLNEMEELAAEENEVPFPTQWEMMADLFVNVEQAAEAVREIANEHSAARDTAASGMERRLHHMVLMAIAAGSPDAQELARQALSTQTLFFDRH